MLQYPSLKVALVLSQGQSSGGAGEWISLLAPFALIFVIFFFLVIRPQQKKEKERQELLKNLKKNDKVVTAGGMMGVVVSVKEPWAVLKVDENKDIRVKVLLSTIQTLLETPGTDKPEEGGETK